MAPPCPEMDSAGWEPSRGGLLARNRGGLARVAHPLADMSPPPTPLPPPPSEARPIDASERLDLLDVLRGFALCGVFVSNSFTWLSGRVLLPRDQAQAMAAPRLGIPCRPRRARRARPRDTPSLSPCA